ncbi:MAG TPA: lipopolysaccharide heptosyltransferase II [Pyrinomonadaceae bacterium]|nr:lipopolysaccharide heptosyltransferase II [Pyrinomonadaceae bacterium]
MARELTTERIGRVVVRGANWVGDAVMTVPALRELRRVLPGARLTLATRPWAEGIFADADFVDELLIVDDRRGAAGFFKQVSEWRARRFDLAVLFPNAFAPALTAFAARVPFRLGYETDGRAPLLTHAVPLPEWRGQRHEVFYYLNLVAELERALTGTTTIGERAPQAELRIGEARRAEAVEILKGRGVAGARPLVALCPGSTNSRAKRWPAERFAALADKLVEEAGAEVLLVGAREELDVTREVVGLMRRAPFVLTGETDLARSTAVLSLVDLLVTNDTGPAHLASALGRPTLVIFGPTNPVTTRPFGESAEIVRRPPDCAPCMLRDCPIDHRCMTAITAEEVFARALSLLSRGTSGGGTQNPERAKVSDAPSMSDAGSRKAEAVR